MGNARQILEPRTFFLFSSSASPSPHRKLMAVVITAHSTFHVRILPNVLPSLPTLNIFFQAEKLQSASLGYTISPPRLVKAMRIIKMMGSTEKIITVTRGRHSAAM